MNKLSTGTGIIKKGVFFAGREVQRFLNYEGRMNSKGEAYGHGSATYTCDDSYGECILTYTGTWRNNKPDGICKLHEHLINLDRFISVIITLKRKNETDE